jgi:hypothetical protein
MVTVEDQFEENKILMAFMNQLLETNQTLQKLDQLKKLIIIKNQD